MQQHVDHHLLAHKLAVAPEMPQLLQQAGRRCPWERPGKHAARLGGIRVDELAKKPQSRLRRPRIGHALHLREHRVARAQQGLRLCIRQHCVRMALDQHHRPVEACAERGANLWRKIEGRLQCPHPCLDHHTSRGKVRARGSGNRDAEEGAHDCVVLAALHAPVHQGQDAEAWEVSVRHQAKLTHDLLVGALHKLVDVGDGVAQSHRCLIVLCRFPLPPVIQRHWQFER
mmetsp:Transcript_65138/g.153822  ORF Transcript_65138/g.153822 Transcript_65138/m.153822 type:complete len:229 (-) Transcript_65138:57-743(-)